jgi:1,6-anhydro-N-acetylmuramate kinase
MKYWLPTDNKWIPTVLLILGAISGAIMFGADYEGIVKGMISGLAAVGLNQVFKQHMKLPMDKDEIKAMGEGSVDTETELQGGDDNE